MFIIETLDKRVHAYQVVQELQEVLLFLDCLSLLALLVDQCLAHRGGPSLLEVHYDPGPHRIHAHL